MRGDVSFTFLHRVEEVEQNIEDERWQSALALALTLPDICGGIAFPEIVKRYRDGRIMLDRQKNPTRDVGGQYIRWFDQYAGAYFKLSPTDEKPYICGDRCWQLRCEYLHQNKGFLNDENESPVRFHLGVNCGTSVCQLDQTTMNSDGMDIRIDIEQFCLRMCLAAKSYYNAVHTQKMISAFIIRRCWILFRPPESRFLLLLSHCYAKMSFMQKGFCRHFSLFRNAFPCIALRKQPERNWESKSLTFGSSRRI